MQSDGSQTRYVDVSVTLRGVPKVLADEVEQMKREDPARLRELFVFAVTRQLVYESLSEALPR